MLKRNMVGVPVQGSTKFEKDVRRIGNILISDDGLMIEIGMEMSHCTEIVA